MRSYQYPYMSNFDDYAYPNVAYYPTIATAYAATKTLRGDCFYNFETKEHTYVGPDGKKGYSKAGCDAARGSYNRAYGKSAPTVGAGNKEWFKPPPGKNEASQCDNCSQDWTTNPLGTIGCEMGKISCETTTGAGKMFGGAWMPLILGVIGLVAVIVLIK